MIVVFDTNVLIAAIVTEGVCSKLLRRARAGEFTLVCCPFISQELESTLSRKFHLTAVEVASALGPIDEAIRQMVQGKVDVKPVCRDPDDDHVLACALAAGAECLVTGDADLLEIGTFQGVKIITPRDFEALLV